MAHQHPANQALHDGKSVGDRIADAVSRQLGSWRFIIAQTVVVLVWIAANGFLLTRPFDVYPFVLLNLAFSTQAAYAAPLLQLASNRQAEHDRLRAEADHAMLTELHQVNATQLDILHRLDGGRPITSSPQES